MLGVIAPVEALIDNPNGKALKVPPVKVPVPANVTAWAVVICLALTYGPVHGFYTNALQRETAPLGVLRAQLAVRLAVLVLIHILAVFASEAVGPTC